MHRKALEFDMTTTVTIGNKADLVVRELVCVQVPVQRKAPEV